MIDRSRAIRITTTSRRADYSQGRQNSTSLQALPLIDGTLFSLSKLNFYSSGGTLQDEPEFRMNENRINGVFVYRIINQFELLFQHLGFTIICKYFPQVFDIFEWEYLMVQVDRLDNAMI